MRKELRNEIIRIGGDNINKSEMAELLNLTQRLEEK